jgi:hypothetical protein
MAVQAYVDIIVQYVWNEFYTDHFPQVFRVKMQNILAGDIITFAIYAVPHFHLSTEFTCSPPTASVGVFKASLQYLLHLLPQHQ